MGTFGGFEHTRDGARTYGRTWPRTVAEPSLFLNFTSATALDPRITFSRGSQATLFDSTGTLVYARNNTLTYSQDFGNAIWSKQASVSVATDTTIAPDGTLTADTVTADSGLSIFQNVTVTIGQRVTQSVYLRAGTATSIMFRDDTGAGRHIVVNPSTGVITSTAGTLIDFGSISMGNGWYRIYMSYTAGSTLARALIRPDSAGSGQTFIVWGAQTNFYPMEGGVTSSLTTYYPTTTAAYYAPRFDYNPSTLQPRGLLIEEQRTNSIRNNTMQGAVAGTPGTAPTNWTITTTNAELVSSVIGTGTESGITYIDIRINGTMTASRDLDIGIETANFIAALTGQAWTESIYLRQVGGSQTNISAIYLQANTYTAAVAYVNSPWFAAQTVTTAALATQRFSASGTLSGATIAFIQPLIKVRTAASGAVDFTLRIGLPQMELGAFATSVIPTTTTALTRNADVASMTGTNFSSWYNQSAGTFLTVYSLARPSSGSNQFTVRASDNTYNNAIAMNTSSTGFPQISTASGGVFDGTATAVSALTANVTVRFIGCYATNDLAVSLNGAAVVTDTSATIPTALTRLDIGSDHAGVNRIQGGYIQRIAYYPTRLANAQLQALTL